MSATTDETYIAIGLPMSTPYQLARLSLAKWYGQSTLISQGRLERLGMQVIQTTVNKPYVYIHVCIYIYILYDMYAYIYNDYGIYTHICIYI